MMSDGCLPACPSVCFPVPLAAYTSCRLPAPQSFLLTSSMDGTIKIWSPGSSAVEVINPTPEFKYPEEDAAGSGGGRGYRPPMQVKKLVVRGRGWKLCAVKSPEFNHALYCVSFAGCVSGAAGL